MGTSEWHRRGAMNITRARRGSPRVAASGDSGRASHAQFRGPTTGSIADNFEPSTRPHRKWLQKLGGEGPCDVVSGSELLDLFRSPWVASVELLRTLAGHGERVCSVAVAFDGTLVTGSWDRTVKLWDPNTGKCFRTLEGHSNGVCSVAIAFDGTLVTGSWDRTVKLWHPNTGECFRTLEGHSDSVSSVAIAPGGTLVSGSWDKTVKLWDPNTGKCLRTLEGHRDHVYSVAVAPDGTLVSGSRDETVKLWDPNTGNCLRTLEGHGERRGTISR